jgi:hypothetical protein
MAVEDSSPAAEAAPRKAAVKPKPAQAPPSRSEGRAAQPMPVMSAPKVREEKPRAKSPFWTPLRGVAIAMSVIVAVTLYFVVHNQRLEDASRRLNAALEEFNEALKLEDWARARHQINQVVSCLDILGKEDAAAMRQRQFQREIEAMTELARAPLFDILEESDADHDSDPAGWEQTYRTRYEGDWVVMELPASRRRLAPAEGDGAGDDEDKVLYAYEFELPIDVGDRGRYVEIELDCDALDKLAWEEGELRSVVVAASLDDLWLSADGSHWTVSFEPTSAFLWANIETYEGLGFEFTEWNPREQVQQLLNEQAAAMGIETSAPATEPANTEIAFDP